MVPEKTFSLVLLRKDGFILLGLKKRGLGTGKWNGFGGKTEGCETHVECAKRELLEEAGMTVENLEKVGYLMFEFMHEPNVMHIHVFTSDTFHGEPTESEEMEPRWFRESEIPFQDMWADDQYWFPLFLKGLKFKGYFKFFDLETISEFDLVRVDKL